MLKHQQLFVAMEQRIDSGIDLLDEYNASLESLNSAIEALDQLESGNTAAALDVQKRFGEQLSMEGVSMEAVYVHVNSAQVQAIIDFLKKWIPILISKIRDVLSKFIDWFKVRLKAIGERAAALRDKIKVSTQRHYTLNVKFNDRVPVGVLAFNHNSWALSRDRSLLRAVAWIEGLLMSAQMDVNASYGAGPYDFVSEMAQWLTLNKHNDLFPVAHHDAEIKEVEKILQDMPSPSEAISVTRSEIQAYTEFGLDMSKEKVLQTLDELDRDQMNNLAIAGQVTKSLEVIRARLAKMGIESKEFKGNQAARYRLAVKFVDYGLKATKDGLQFRLEILSDAIRLLEKMTKIKRD